MVRDARAGTPSGSFETEEVVTVQIHHLEAPDRHRGPHGEGVFGDLHGDAGLLREQAIEPAQQRTATGEHDTALGDVGAKFRRRLLEARS